MLALCLLILSLFGQIPDSNRIVYNLNYDWLFIKCNNTQCTNLTNSQDVDFNDTQWKPVSLPHTYNDIDMFDSHDNHDWTGKVWYRKYFTLAENLNERNVFVEFEGIRQAGEVYVNGEWAGRHEDGVGPAGIDITQFVKFGTKNVLAVQVDNNGGYKEIETGQDYQWNTANFYPNYGGLVSNAKLHLTDKLYQTLPLYTNLKTVGVYVYALNIDLAGRTADVTVEAEIHNSYAASKTLNLVVQIVDGAGKSVASGTLTNQAYAAGAVKVVKVTLALKDIKFWSPDMPYLYRVYSSLQVDGKTLDAVELPLGVRVFNFTFDDGLSINGKPLYLNGFAPRTTMEWATVGQANDFLSEYDFSLLKEVNANFLRPMHCAPKFREVRAADKFGIIYVAPAGDGEGDSDGDRWQQRLHLARDRMIYFRNNPSVVFWEGGNTAISVEHMNDMLAIKKTYDPNGGRFQGCRASGGDLEGLTEYGSTMDRPGGSKTTPVWDAEYARGECPRRVWDKYSPPYVGGYSTIADEEYTIVEYPDNDFRFNSMEDLAMNNVWKYWQRWDRRGGQVLEKPLSEIMVGGAKIIFADSNSDGRLMKNEVARTGTLDGARIPKQSYYALRVCHSPVPDLHLVGHWTYPPRTVKKIYAVSNCERVNLAVYDTAGKLVKDYGDGVQNHTFEFSWADVAFATGKIVATAYNGNTLEKTMEIESVDEPVSLKLTPTTGPRGFVADGSDIAIIDVEALDANGRRAPLEGRQVNFTYEGAGATYLGGYNSGVVDSIYKDFLLLESDINRIFLRGSRTPGPFTVTATAAGLKAATVTVWSTPIAVENGLSLAATPQYEITPSGNDVDDLPNQIRIVPQADLAASAVATSEPFVLSGFLGQVPLSLSDSTGTAASFSVNGGAFQTNTAQVKAGDSVQVRLTAGAQAKTIYRVRVTVGGVWAYFYASTK